MKPLIILTGPTAVGKTELSVQLAKKINGEIISADSIQVYKYMDIGSAKVTEEEKEGIKHYLIDALYPDEEFNIAVFKKMAETYIEEIYHKGKIPILVGGTGFYIQSVLYDIQFSETEADYEYRKKLEEMAGHHGNLYLHEMLKKVDKAAAEKIHYNNVKRVIRALEYYQQTGQKISEHNEEQRKNISPYNFIYFVLKDDREKIYERINQRVDRMVAAGLQKEVENLLAKGYGRELVSMQGIGYREMAEYLSGECSLEEAVYHIKINTRHFAKRQLTWFRREKEVTMLDYRDFHYDKNVMLQEMIKLMIEKEIIPI